MIKVAFMYDFDKTLSPKDMQEFGFLPSLGFDDPKKFWEEVSAFKDERCFCHTWWDEQCI